MSQMVNTPDSGRERVGSYMLNEAQRTTRDGRYRIEVVANDGAIIRETATGRQMGHRSTVYHCLGWLGGYDTAAALYANRDER